MMTLNDQLPSVSITDSLDCFFINCCSVSNVLESHIIWTLNSSFLGNPYSRAALFTYLHILIKSIICDYILFPYLTYLRNTSSYILIDICKLQFNPVPQHLLTISVRVLFSITWLSNLKCIVIIISDKYLHILCSFFHSVKFCWYKKSKLSN